MEDLLDAIFDPLLLRIDHLNGFFYLLCRFRLHKNGGHLLKFSVGPFDFSDCLKYDLLTMFKETPFLPENL